jgi:hypothetical protein
MAASSSFPPGSRYGGVGTLEIDTGDGRVTYLARRWVPAPRKDQLVRDVALRIGERIDNFTARTLADPLQFWRVCDASLVMDPFEVTDEVGDELSVPVGRAVDGA